MKYRAEIDGLRAIAVLPVIFFHAGIVLFSGGYVGVDVFFVISGYLITTIILGDIAAGKFTISGFYERRVRRIFPALTVVILACVPIAYFWMLPNQLEEFSQSLVAVSFFSSNILFWLQTGYFETTAELKPLLHTWSLAVEEQYYLFFPLLTIYLSKFGKRTLLGSLVFLGLASLYLAHYRMGMEASAAFYLIFTRLWELLIGSCTAIYLYENKRFDQKKAALPAIVPDLLGGTGLFLILYGIAAFGSKTVYPSFYTLAPTLGTALIILFSSRESLVGKFLGNKIFVGIGLISYSAYLWHQPIFAFVRMTSVKEPTHGTMFLYGLLSLGLAYFTWRFIETPFRDKNKFDRRKIFLYGALASFVIIGLGVLGILYKGFSGRVSPNGTPFANFELLTSANYGLAEVCDYDNFVPLEQCQTDPEPEILVWGDSFAMQLVPGILASNPDAGIIQMTQSGCASILGLQLTVQYDDSEGCIEFNGQVMDWLSKNDSVRYVVISSRYAYYLDKDYYLVQDGEVIPVNRGLILSQLNATLDAVSKLGKTPVIFEPLPSDGRDIGNCLIKKTYYFRSLDCQVNLTAYRRSLVLRFLKEIKPEYPVIWLSRELCGKQFCAPEMDGVNIYYDGEHLSIPGSEYLGKKMDFYTLITSQ